MKQKLFTLFFALAASVTIHAAIIDGTCGANLTWSLNTKDSTLTIEGSGKMTNWTNYQDVPWFDNRSYIKTAIIGDGVTSIGIYAFYHTYKMTAIQIPSSITKIERNAFQECAADTIIIPDGVVSIEKETFKGSGVVCVKTGNGVKTIGESAFSGCSSLASIYLGNNVKTIELHAFQYCQNNLSEVHVSNLASFCQINFTEPYYGDFYNPLSYAKHLFIDDDEVIDLVIPENVTQIGNYTFCYCRDFSSVTIPNSVTRIGKWAFYNCEGLTSLIIPNSVTTIDEAAFDVCRNLETIELGTGITTISSIAFSGCPISKLTIRATTPPQIGSSCGIKAEECSLYVPATAIEAYANSAWWEDFKEIIPIPAQNPIVKFVDWDGTVLSSVEVEEGSAATPPENPTREGYTFIGWDKDFSNVTEDLIVTAQYKINRYYVQFLDWDDSVLKADSVDWNTAAVAPANPSREGYDFTGWNKEFSSITSNLVVQAQYEFGQTTNYPMTFINGRNSEEIFDEVVTIKVPAAPMIAGFTFVKWEIVSGDLADGFVIQAVYKSDTPTSAPAVYTNPANPAQKLIRNGSVYILTEDKTYTLTGQAVK